MNKSSELLVSVCMITYKHEEFLDMAIKGVLSQKTSFKIELIISDDASPDRTKDIVKKYLNNSNELINVVYHRHETNKGAIPNFEWTLKQCAGKYIAICEGDDYWTDPYKIQKQINFLEKNELYVLVFHSRYKLNQKDQSIELEEILLKNQSVNFNSILATGMKIPTQTVVFKNLIQEYPKEFVSVLNGDTFLFLLLAKLGDFFYLKELNGAVYRIHDLGIWSSKKKVDKIKEGIKSFEIFLKVFNDDISIIKVLLKRRKNMVKHYFQNKNYTSLLIFILKDFKLLQTVRLILKTKINF